MANMTFKEKGNPKNIATKYVIEDWIIAKGISGNIYPSIKLYDFIGMVYNLFKNELSLSFAIKVAENCK